MTPTTTDHAYYYADDDCDDANLDRHRTTNESDEDVYDGNDYADLIVSILKRRTADPLPIPDGSNNLMHHQWQGEAGDEDYDIIDDIIEQQRNLMRRAYDVDPVRDDVLRTRTITEEIDPDHDDVLGTSTITEDSFPVTVPNDIASGETLTFMVSRTIAEKTYRVIVPDTVAPGETFMVFVPNETFMVYAGGHSVCVRCPQNTMPGEQVQIKVPVLNSIMAIEPMPRSPRRFPARQRRESRIRTWWWSRLASIRDKFHRQRTA
jgi:hypothetical protein